MAMDGSFNLEAAVERFLARCPKLQALPQFDLLVKKGCMVTEDEVVKTVAEVFLLPNYTIPLMGCFQPIAIARKIVDRAVALLRLVPNLRSNSSDALVEFEEDKILIEYTVIDFYNGVRKGLDLHELACLAFCRTLDLAPSLLGSVLSYFEFAPPPFQRLLIGLSVSEFCTKDISQLRCAVWTSYRFLLRDSDKFSRLWDWSCFLDLLKQSENLDLCKDGEFFIDLRWCGTKIVSLVLKLSDKVTANLGMSDANAFSCLLRWEDFCQDVSLENAGWYMEPSKPNKLGSLDESSDFNQKSCLQSFSTDPLSFSSSQVYLESPYRSKRLATWDNPSSGNPFVLTSAVKRSFEMVLLAVSQKWPVLLYGPSGCGKSSLINKLAQDSGNQVLSIHMDDQIDGKTLIGSYVCTERPGEFRWQPGSLSQAVLNGYWVVFEDIDKAPSDVHSVLLPLLEGTSSFVTAHGEEIQVAESFRLFSTISTLRAEISSIIEGGNSLSVFWRRVMVGPPNVEDLQNIVRASYPSLEPLAEKLIQTFDRLKSGPLNQLDGFHSGESSSVSYLSRFSLRDLLKWCKRIAGLGFSFIGNSLSVYECQCIYQEAVDIFAAFSTSIDNRSTIRKDIAKLWAVPPTGADTFYPSSRPIIQDSLLDIRIGRVSLCRSQTTSPARRKSFVEIRNSLHLLESLAASVKYNEPVLMVGETGTGKTTLVQDLALRLGQKLTVLNLSQQSDIADLLGGFKPIDAQFICFPLFKEFEDLFSKTFSVEANKKFLFRLQKHLIDKEWKMLLKGFQKGVETFRKSVENGLSESDKKRKKPLDEEKIKAWESFSVNFEAARVQVDASSGIIFSFVEGAFVNALKNGEWILLDEVNLAPPETLQRVTGVLEGDKGSLCLAERGDVSCILRHPNFRLFACMNPATDAGKRDLPFSLRSRFTEYFVDDVLDDEDLTLFVNKFMGERKSSPELVNKIVRFYKAAKRDSEERLQDGANQKPQYSLRSLYRALEYTRNADRTFGLQRALYDGFSMFFQTLLDKPSAKIMDQMVVSNLMEGKIPGHVPFDRYLSTISNSDSLTDNYILTGSVRENLRNVARAIFIKKYPVLLQGPTSSGKTSLIRYLAAITGHEFVRINNHEHTDLQEYLGTYITDAGGNLVFHEGILVKAVRKGCWIVLDELNLAPSDVLEALNRLLDDNRELFVPELQETIRADPNFMLFATQNPPTVYGGRKMLSRAFRNRFVEIHVDEIPEDELSTIIEQRCLIPGTYAKKMVEIMKELQLNRQRSKVFAGKHGYITPRDLFRWADRFRKLGGSYTDLARDGYYLLAERLREDAEKCVIREVLEKHLHVKLVCDDLYNEELVGVHNFSNAPQSIIWTKSMQRLYFLVERCYRVREPVLLVGETGGGKTTVCQLLSTLLGSNLHILNCHQYTETSDFLGGFYPIRERSRLASDFKKAIEQMVISDAFNHFRPNFDLFSDIDQAPLILRLLEDMIKTHKQVSTSSPDVTNQHLKTLEGMVRKLSELHQKWQTIFMWQDGPLVEAMRDGDLFLVDEISLAEDSVLERLNSVLEPERTLTLAEKGGPDLEKIVAHDKFLLLATMNPGGDFGKKELSPALRNRFTEIWVPSVCYADELRCLALQRLSSSKLSCLVDPMISFWEWFGHRQTGRMLTVRDLLSWVDFINVTESRLGAEYACLHGVFLVLLDGLSLGSGISKRDAEELREQCLSFILEQMKVEKASLQYLKLSTMQNYGWVDLDTTRADSHCDGDMLCDNIFGFDPFYIQKGSENCEVEGFEFKAPTTHRNALRVLRAMQLPKPVILEGSPGVGKTSLVVALGKFSGHRVVRINLSEQTDMMDLLGSDLPVESDEGMKFAWSDGILLQALKEGCWVLLDELNLAPQSVLEGLNAILDHRAEVFIPELGLTFKCPSSFRIFACQNPSNQGGGRKGLPKSFLNRFTKVYLDELIEADYHFICSSLFPSIPEPLLDNLIKFNKRLYEETMLDRKFAQEGSPWEFNLRDVVRSCQIIQGAPDKSRDYCFLNIVYIQRMRTEADRRQVLHLYEQIFGEKPYVNPYPRVQLNSRYLIVGNTSIERNRVQSSKTSSNSLKILPGIRQSLEAAAQCVKNQWLCILIGPPSSGKTSLIRLLAQLTGNVLNELHLSSGTDISEIVGCFEQYNAFRNFRSVVAQVECYINEYCSLRLEPSNEAFMGEEGLINRWFAFLSGINENFLSCFTSRDVEDRKRFVNSLTLLIEIIQQLKSVLDSNFQSLSWSSKQLDRAMKTIFKLQEGHQKQSFSVKFEWVAGLLIRAIECGEWIVLENANCCNPTVLDRINSLVEPSGSITVNECGIVDGKPVTLHPHPNFRMFLTINPSYGEVSRAMRNRGVEIFLMQPCWLRDEISGFNGDEFELKDVERFLVLSGIPVDRLVQAMTNSHIYARKEGLHFNISITYLELSRWVQLFQQLIMNGNQLLWSLHTSWEHIYLSSLGEADGVNIVTLAKHEYLSDAKLSGSCLSVASSLCLPGGWPMPMKLRDFVLYPRESNVKQNCMYLQFLGAQCASYGTTYVMDMKMLHQIMFPGDSNYVTLNSWGSLDLELAKKMLFSAIWTIEQATEGDLNLYLLWFNWSSSWSQPLSELFFNLIKPMVEHPIWNYLTHQYHERVSLHQVDIEKRPIPMLSLERLGLVDEAKPKDRSTTLYSNAVNCIGVLKLTYQQWNDEHRNHDDEEVKHFVPILTSLRSLEEDFLKKLVDSSFMLIESPLFDSQIQIYAVLLEYHVQFWNGVRSSDLGKSVISWRSLLKCAEKLKELCPEAVENLRKDGGNLRKISSWRSISEKSLLWIYGGHPLLPPSAGLFEKQLKLLKFCEFHWPSKTQALKPGDRIEIVASSDSVLRSLVIEGISMSSSITSKFDYGEKQLQDMHTDLEKRFDHVKTILEKLSGHNIHDVTEANSPGFCSYSTEILCQESGFDSWQDTLSLIDTTSFYLDMELLQELAPTLLVDSGRTQLALASIYKQLKAALDFSKVFSTRPPQMFLPHQKVLWIHDAWTEVDAANAKLGSFVLEMWFRWHQSLWIYHPISVKNFSKINYDDVAVPDVVVPDMLVQPVMMATVFEILQSTTLIKDYHLGSLKLKVASCNLWRSLSPGMKLLRFLLSAARCLFMQIIFAHQKAFDADEFAEVKSIICSLQTNIIEEKNLKLEKFQRLKSLIRSSSHHRLKGAVDSYIAPLLERLYYICSSTDSLSNLGHAWLHLGGLRLYLLLSCDDLDPAMKYHCKNSRLAEKISSLKLEIQVRQECECLAGWLSTSEGNKKQTQESENLEMERKKLQRKIVFRSDHGQFKTLKHECDEFLLRVKSLEILWSDNNAMNLKQILAQGYNWQRTATGFIEKLSDNYPEFIDFVQPVQVAVYEMKLGFSLFVSSLMEGRILKSVNRDNMDVVTESIYSFMKFPWASPWKTLSVNFSSELPECPPYELEISNFDAADIDQLENLVSFSSDTVTTDQSVSQLKASLYHNILFRTAYFLSNTHMMDSESFKKLDKIFGRFAKLWMRMKEQAKIQEGIDSQQFKLRSRAFKIDTIIELDISTLGNSLDDESYMEWKDLVSEDEGTAREEACNEQDNSEKEWNSVEESVVNNVVHIHNLLFGSNGFVVTGALQISDADQLLSFTRSYMLGVEIIRGLGGSFFSRLDASLAPEHLLRLCVEHEQKVVSSHKSTQRYKFYKDSNALEMSKMVKVLYPLRERILSLLEKWEDDYGLQKIFNVIEMLLNVPLDVPLAKPLSGLQFLVNTIRVLKENGSKFSLSDQLDSVHVLMVSWQKMEFESWPALLDEVQDQCDMNAGKLWFPLYSVLQRQHSAQQTIQSLEESFDAQQTIQSLEEFIQMSSVGEFRKRLQLLFAFLGQIYTGQCLNIHSSSYEVENLKILFNVYGFYVQFLQRILEHIEASRRGIEKELKEVLKLCSWERPEIFLSIENSKRTRQKLKKLLHKYSELLQQPVKLFLNQDASLSKTRVQSEHSQTSLGNFMEKNMGMTNATSDKTLDEAEDRFKWYADWREKTDVALQNLKLDMTPGFNVLYSLSEGLIRQCSVSQPTSLLYQDEWNALWCKLKSIFITIIDCGDLWKDANKSLQKRRALTELLKLFENSGLSRHKPIFLEDQVKSWWFLQPSYDLQHLQLTHSSLTPGASDVATLDKPQSLPHKNLVTEWTTANECYFRSVASVLLLQQICLNSHKDITLEQVHRSSSFLHQLVEIQQKQHDGLMVFAKHLKRFKECASLLRNLNSSSSISDGGICSSLSVSKNQDAIFKCMWQQKQLFDSLCSISHDELLLLKTFDNIHLKTCETVKAAANGISAFIKDFLPIFQNSKELLDNILLGQDTDITKVVASPHLFIIPQEMEELVSMNFLVLTKFEKHLLALHEEDMDRSSVKETLLGHFKEVLKKGRLVQEEYISASKGKNELIDISDGGSFHGIYSKLNSEFLEAFKSTFKHIVETIQRLCRSCNDQSLSNKSLGNITSWKFLFESLVTNLSLDDLSNKLLWMIFCAKKLLNGCGDRFQSVSLQIGAHFKHLYALLDILSNFGDGLLQEFLEMRKMVSSVTRKLADILASLFSNGFGVSAEDEVSDSGQELSKDASGTGMGEGAGLNDVSEQITDEDQLLGASDKQGDEHDASDEAPSKTEKGIEMDQDFEADTFDVSEDSEEDMNEEDGEDEQLESAMGETGADSEVVDEKLWNKDEDESPNDTSKEKYESGPSVRDKDTSSRELRAKEDSALTADESGEPNSQELNQSDDEIGNQDDLIEDGEDVNLDKEEAFEESTDLKLDELNKSSAEDMDLDEQEGLDREEDADNVKEVDTEVQDESTENANPEEDNACPNDDETMGEAETEQQDVTSEREEPGGDDEQNGETNLMGSRREVFGPGFSDSLGDSVPNSESQTQPKGEQASFSHNMEPEQNWTNSNDIHDGLAPLSGLPSSSTSKPDMMVSESSNSGRKTGDQPLSQLPEHDSSSDKKNQPNPYRSIGDALEEWKQRAKVSVDLQADNMEAQEDTDDKNAEEFGYVSEFEKGTSQAMGVATSEQIDKNVNSNIMNENEPTSHSDDVTEMEIEEPNSETHPVKNGASFLKSKIEDKMPLSETEELPSKESREIQNQDNDEFKGVSDGLVSVRKSYLREGADQLSKLSIDDRDLGKAKDPDDASSDAIKNASALWKRYELLTTRLSQELAEQLRLVMEPTLASKLQGDYKTGKRINMKKVIPYIASNYRRDKIWLRRTRPNKRDYQVVIAVDDSRSMSESCCGNVAIEALVAVCRAMSQLEMGDLAVASFGKKGNIRLLHDFDQPFSGEAGVKMISNLTFKQENTIADEPVVDLLKFVNNKLDAAVAKARLPSGQNPLQQLVLIIADGRFHEKENLRRCVRDVLSKKRMVAFLLLDNPQESIVDLKEVSIEGGSVKFTRYLDSFPFPYYIVLRNIESLPRTLADLLRQWFELMQSSRE
ncbi:hypothetical protein UlMin_011961 [Ulmus minor]